MTEEGSRKQGANSKNTLRFFACFVLASEARLARQITKVYSVFFLLPEGSQIQEKEVRAKNERKRASRHSFVQFHASSIR